MLVGRITRSLTYAYSIVPKLADFPDVDVFETSLPPSLVRDRIRVNTSTLYEVMTTLPLVEFRWRKELSIGGLMDKATILGVKKLYTIDVTNPEPALKELDSDYSYATIEETPLVERSLLLSLKKVTGTGIAKPKRFLSTQVVTCVEIPGQTDCKPAVLSLAEVYSFLQENPGLIKGIAFLPSYMLVMLILDKVPYDALKALTTRISMSALQFYDDYSVVIERASARDRL